MIIALQGVSIDDTIVDSLGAIEHRVRLKYAQEELSALTGIS